jgi:polyisoprenyl-phosphate glycosyltransferase
MFQLMSPARGPTLTNDDLLCDEGDLRLITRRVLDLLVAMPERHRFIRGMVAWIGGTQAPLVYGREPRVASSPRPWPPTARRCER